jgi:hypothetical protein
MPIDIPKNNIEDDPKLARIKKILKELEEEMQLEESQQETGIPI